MHRAASCNSKVVPCESGAPSEPLLIPLKDQENRCSISAIVGFSRCGFPRTVSHQIIERGLSEQIPIVRKCVDLADPNSLTVSHQIARWLPNLFQQWRDDKFDPKRWRTNSDLPLIVQRQACSYSERFLSYLTDPRFASSAYDRSWIDRSPSGPGRTRPWVCDCAT